MSRYIDADALKARKQLDGETYRYYIKIEDVYSAPHIDIVRCKECRYCKRKRGTFKGEPITFYRCTENNRDVESDDFCSLGEREGE